MPLKDKEARRAYHKAYSKKHYQENKDYYLNKAKSHNKNQRKWGREFIKRVKAMRGCIDCGESDPVVLEFDHVRGDKVMNVADMVNKSYGISTIKEEIRKCEVRCANCHRKVTHRRRNRLDE